MPTERGADLGDVRINWLSVVCGWCGTTDGVFLCNWCGQWACWDCTTQLPSGDCYHERQASSLAPWPVVVEAP